MITVAGVTLSISSLYIGLYWMVAGAICTLFTERRGLYVAIALPIVIAVVPHVFWINAPQPGVPTFQWFRFGVTANDIVNLMAIPFFACVIGALIGELILPSEEEE